MGVSFKTIFIYFFLSFFISLPAKDWSEQMKKQENLLHNIIIGQKNQNIWRKQVDEDGRRFFSRGTQYRFPIYEKSYRVVFPIFKPSTIHIYWQESLFLFKNRKYLDAIRLSNHLKLCHTVLSKENKAFIDIASVQRILNLALKKWQDSQKDLLFSTEPYGCRVFSKNQPALFLHSRYIPFSLKISGNWFHLKTRLQRNKSVRIRMIQLSRSQSSPLPELNGWQKALATQPSNSHSKIILAIGSALFSSDRSLTKAGFKQFWDRKRGLTPAIRREYVQQKSLLGGGFETTLHTMPGDRLLFTREIYQVKRNSGVAFFLSFSEKDKERALANWREILSSIGKKNKER